MCKCTKQFVKKTRFITAIDVHKCYDRVIFENLRKTSMPQTLFSKTVGYNEFPGNSNLVQSSME